MERNTSSVEELKAIRKIMEESTKFLSLSGLSGIFLGLFAIGGAVVAWLITPGSGDIRFSDFFGSLPEAIAKAIRWKMVIVSLAVLLLSLACGFYLSARNAKRSGTSFWTPASKRLLVNLFIPLVTGGLLALILMTRNQLGLVIPVFLIFYGLALINAGKFTYSEIFYLGILEIITGLVAAVFPAGGLIFWIIGFGVLHIVYGLFLYRKYEV